MKLFIILIFSIGLAFANNSKGYTFKITCKAKFRDDKGNVKVKEYPVTLYGHFDDPDEKCQKACMEKECKVVSFSI